jgi:RNA polymerase sigma-70 factor (ECF subfamily)
VKQSFCFEQPSTAKLFKKTIFFICCNQVPFFVFYEKKNLHISEDKILLEEIKREPSKFSIVFDEYYAVIFGYIFRRVVDYDIAKDIASETFLKAFLNIRSYKWKGVPVLAWLYRIASNECLLYFRKRKYEPDSLDKLISAKFWDAADPATTMGEKLCVEKELQQHKDFSAVQQKIIHLPVAYQEVLSLRYFEEKNIIYVQTDKISIRNPAHAPMHIDGDPRESLAELDIQILPHYFNLIQPW